MMSDRPAAFRILGGLALDTESLPDVRLAIERLSPKSCSAVKAIDVAVYPGAVVLGIEVRILRQRVASTCLPINRIQDLSRIHSISAAILVVGCDETKSVP